MGCGVVVFIAFMGMVISLYEFYHSKSFVTIVSVGLTQGIYYEVNAFLLMTMSF